jgi:uncharacterized membrane protein SirB2
MYTSLKLLHQLCIVSSFSLFLLRGLWMWQGRLATRGRWVKSLPAAIDTVLLGSGLALIWTTGFTPFNSPWLATKLGLLLAYIVSGALALHYARRLQIRLIWLLTATLIFIAMVALALNKPPLWLAF